VKKTYHRSCHCGAGRFEADVDFLGRDEPLQLSFCRKARFWKAIAKADGLRVMAGAEMLHEYRVTGFITHCFRRRCCIKPFGRSHMEALGGTFYGVKPRLPRRCQR